MCLHICCQQYISLVEVEKTPCPLTRLPSNSTCMLSLPPALHPPLPLSRVVWGCEQTCSSTARRVLRSLSIHTHPCLATHTPPVQPTTGPQRSVRLSRKPWRQRASWSCRFESWSQYEWGRRWRWHSALQRWGHCAAQMPCHSCGRRHLSQSARV